MEFVFDRVENIVEKGKNAGYHSVFKSIYFRVLKNEYCVLLMAEIQSSMIPVTSQHSGNMNTVLRVGE